MGSNRANSRYPGRRQGEAITLRSDLMKGEVTAVFLNRVLLRYPGKPILLLWDRATPQEHVWKATREAVSHDHTHSHLTDLADAFETYLRTTKFLGSLFSKRAYHKIAVRSK